MESRPWYALAQAIPQSFLHSVSNPRVAQAILCFVCCGWTASCGGGGSSYGPQNNPAPSAASLSPSSATAGGSAFTLMVAGSNFISSSTVQWNGSARTTTFVSGTSLQAALAAADIATAGTANVTVSTPAPGGGTSSALVFHPGLHRRVRHAHARRQRGLHPYRYRDKFRVVLHGPMERQRPHNDFCL